MKKDSILLLLVLTILASIAIACGAPPSPTPTAVPPTPIPSNTPTRPATAAPTASRTFTPVPVTPTNTAAPATPTRLAILDTPTRPPATARPRPPAPTGAIVFHRNQDGVDRLFYVDPNSSNVTDFLPLGGGEMDLTIDTYGTNARIGEFSPDGTRFAYVFSGGPGKVNVLQVKETANTTKAPLALFSDKGISTPSWSPDGSRIIFIRQSNVGFALTIVDSKAGKVDGKSFLEVKADELAGAEFRGGISWAKTNLLVLAANVGGASDIYTMFPDTDKSPIVKNLTNNPAEDTTPVFSPDGKGIAFTSTRDGRPQIYFMNADGSGLRRVSNGQADDTSPTWSPDGNWIAFVSNRDGGGNIYIMDAFGGNLKRLTSGDHPAWSH